MQGQKDEIIRTMVKENLKIIVSIDDIDRLSEEEIIAVFQLVKALANEVFPLPHAPYSPTVKEVGKVDCNITLARLSANDSRFSLSSEDLVMGSLLPNSLNSWQVQ